MKQFASIRSFPLFSPPLFCIGFPLSYRLFSCRAFFVAFNLLFTSIHKKSVAIGGVVSPLSKILLRFGGLLKNLLRLEGLLRSRGWFLLHLGWLFSGSLAIDRGLNPVAILGDIKIGRASALPAR